MVAEESRILRAAKKEARELFKKVRAEAGIVEYTDTRAVGWVGDVVEQLYNKEAWTDILAAVKSIARQPKTSPWAIRDECYRLAAQRIREAAVTRKASEYEIGANLPREPGLAHIGRGLRRMR